MRTTSLTKRVIASVGVVAATLALAVPAPASAEPADARIASAVAALDGIVADVMARSGVPGAAVAVVHGDELLYAKGFGVRDVRTGAPVTADTVFQIASMSKPVGASVVAAAVQRGIVDWDDPIQEHLPWFELSDSSVSKQVTVGDMYAMRSGLPAQAGDLLEMFGFNRRQILERLRYLPLNEFRTTFAYANFSTTTGAQAVAEASGKSWARLSRELLYEPLGMTSTSSTEAEFRSRANKATLHVLEADGYVARYERHPDAQAPAGGVSSNVIDLAAWMQMELADGAYRGKQIVSATALATANTAQVRRSAVGTAATLPSFYGFGMNVDIRNSAVMLSHSGAFSAGGGTTFALLPSERLGIVVLSNALAGAPEAIAATFMDLVQQGKAMRDYYAMYRPMIAATLAQDPQFDATHESIPGRPASELVGRYANDFYGEVVVVERDGQLAVVVGPARVVIPLEHWSSTTFVATMPDEGPSIRFWVDFEGNERKAAVLRLELSDDETSLLSRVR